MQDLLVLRALGGLALALVVQDALDQVVVLIQHLLDGLLSDLPFASRPRRREGHGHGGGADSARDHWGLFSGCAPRPEVPILRRAGAGTRGARCRGLARLPVANARSSPPRPHALRDCLPGQDTARRPPAPGLRSSSSR